MRSPSVLAIDCGASRVSTAAFAAASDGTPVIESVAIEPLACGRDDDREWLAAVGGAIGRLAGPRVRGKRKVTLLVPGWLTLTKYLRVPHVDEASRRRIVQFEARQNIPYPLEEVVWDYEVVHDDGVDFEVAMCMIKVDIVEGLLAECRKAGFEPVSIEPACMSQINAFRFCYPEVRENTLLINIGARASNLVFMREDRSFVRNVSYAGDDLTKAMAGALQTGEEAADRFKMEICERGVEGLAPEVAAAFDGALQTFTTRLALEVTRTVANYRRQSGVESPVRVLVTGGGARVPGLIDALAGKLQSPVEDYDPLRGVPVGTGAVEGEIRAGGHFVGEALGAALSIYEKSLVRFEFLPPGVLQARAFRRRQPFLLASAVSLVAAAAIPVAVGSVSYSIFRSKVADFDAQIAPLRARSQKIAQMQEQIETTKRQIAGIKGLVETKSNWISFFTDLQDRLVKVEDVWLDRLQVLRPQGGQVKSSALSGSLFTGLAGRPAAQGPLLRLNLAGRLIDKNNPLSKVSQESQERVKALLDSFKESAFILEIEKESFDNSQPGILKFEFILVVDPQHPL